MAETIIIKRCSYCKQIKAVSDFYKNRKNKDGFENSCKICRKISIRKYQKTEKGRLTNRKSVKKYRKTKKGKAYRKRHQQSKKGKDTQKRYIIRHPERRKARNAVSYAIEVGKLFRPNILKCHYCPEQAEQYHHPSYEPEDRLNIIPVCKICHKYIHSH